MYAWIAFFSVALSFSCFANAQQLPTVVDAPVEKVFIPLGFDDNDNIEVMVHGHFPNGCQRLGDITVTKDDSRNQITLEVKALSYQQAGMVCSQALVPFLEKVKIGLLEQGVHRVIVNPGPNQVSKVLVVGKRTTDMPDEHLYAPVEFADISKDADSGVQYLSIQGRYPMLLKGCARVVEVRQHMDAEDLLTVLPIMEVFHDGSCGYSDFRYKLQVPLEVPFTKSGLLYVRKYEGSAFDKLITP